MLAQGQGLQARHRGDLLKCGGVQVRTVDRDLFNSNQPGKGQSISVSDRDIHQGDGEDFGIPKEAAAEFFYSPKIRSFSRAAAGSMWLLMMHTFAVSGPASVAGAGPLDQRVKAHLRPRREYRLLVGGQQPRPSLQDVNGNVRATAFAIAPSSLGPQSRPSQTHPGHHQTQTRSHNCTSRRRTHHRQSTALASIRRYRRQGKPRHQTQPGTGKHKFRPGGLRHRHACVLKFELRGRLAASRKTSPQLRG
ncbi:Uncharacterised protein [Xylophilus ampelinus]|nr:Uncharacterised protein [Xylophilus ampelinus]